MNTPNNRKFTSLVSKLVTEKAVDLRRHSARLAFLAALAVAGLASAMPASAVTLSQLAGTWQAALSVVGGCGAGAKLVTFTLNSSGVATNAAASYNTVQCGEGSESGTFTITYLSPEGHGDANLNFGGTVFNFHIQVAPNGQIFNLVETSDPDNYESGTAILQ